MEDCFKCGISGEIVPLYDVITNEGIKKYCERCAFQDDIPMIKKPTDIQLKESERKQTVYERLSKAAGIKSGQRDKNSIINREDTALKDIVNKNYLQKVASEGDIIKKDRPDLVQDFHWIIMRSRRMRHLTQGDLAMSIGEAESAIRMAERGILPDDDYKLIAKIQSFLNIRLVKKETEEDVRNFSRKLNFDPFLDKGITIGDIKESYSLGSTASNESLVAQTTLGSKSEKSVKVGIFKKIKNFFSMSETDESQELLTKNEASKDPVENLNLDNLSSEQINNRVKKDLKENLLKRSEMSQTGKKRDLTKKEIDDLIFGKKR